MVNNSTIVNKLCNHISPQIVEHEKDHNIWCWKFRSWLGTGTKRWWGYLYNLFFFKFYVNTKSLLSKILCKLKILLLTQVTSSFFVFKSYYKLIDQFVSWTLKQGLISYMAVLGIIYCFTQKESEEVTTELKQRGIKTGCYHANVSPKQKSQIHEMWLANKILVSKITVSKDRMLPC